MKIEIWSDVTCTHCYVAKRKFEIALAQFKDRDKIEIVWRSFELAPGFVTDPKKVLPEFLRELRGISAERVQEEIDYVTNSASEVGLEYNLNKTIPANSFNAHRLSHFAQARGLQGEMEERMFKAYFIEGMNIDDISTLQGLAKEVGLDEAEVKAVLTSTKFTDAVNSDLLEAKRTGITSIPRYVFNSNSMISGVQDTKVYQEVLEREFAIWKSLNLKSDSVRMDGQSCKIGEACE